MENFGEFKKEIEPIVFGFLTSSTYGRENVQSRKSLHLYLSGKILYFLFPKFPFFSYQKATQSIRKFLADHFTDRMDEEIGFPVWDPDPDLDLLTKLFLEKLHSILPEIKKMLEETYSKEIFSIGRESFQK